MTKLLMIGLDGATFRVLKPLCAEGKLPNLGHLLAKGSSGILESTYPPFTAPAWTSMATGKNPGKHGVYDFLNRTRTDSFETRVINSSYIRRASPFWDYLSSAGIWTGVVNYPFLYPPYKINGVMVSGLGSDPKDNISYPEEFKNRLAEICQSYRIHIPWQEPPYIQNPSLFIRDIFELIEINRKTIQYLLQQDLEVITFVVSACDFAQHYMWRYIDPSHPYYQKEEAEEYGPAFTQIWEKIDAILGMVIESAPQANIFIVSDHGFGPHRSSFYPNSWLGKEGYLRKRGILFGLSRLQHFSGNLVRRLFPALYNKLVKAAEAGAPVKLSTDAPIDFKKSLAFAPIGTSVGGIFINKSAVPSGEGNAEALKSEIIERLKKTCESLGLSVQIHLRHELYSGQHVELAPDIAFEIDDFECDVDSGLNDNFYQYPPTSASFSGTHKKEGIFIAYGPDIKKGCEINGAKIYDIAPTVLHTLCQSLPDDMDGRVLTEIFASESEVAQRKVIFKRADLKSLQDRISKLKESGKL